MTNIWLSDHRCAQFPDTTFTTDEAASLWIEREDVTLAIFARGTWTAAFHDRAEVEWTPTEQPAPTPPTTKEPTPRFGVIDHGS
jgi:hypothetical protein